MDRNLIYAGASVVLAGMLGFNWGQGRGAINADEPKVTANDIAVVDLAKVFDNHKRLTEKRDEVRRDFESAKAGLNVLVAAVKKLQDELKLHKPGSSDHARIQKELQQKTEAAQKFEKDHIQEFREAEAKIFQDAYRRISEEIQRIAEARGLRLVLRSQAENLDANDPKKLFNSLNRQVLYEKGLDITDEVVQAVNN
jgi:Skp family chaperone for outer membrane proteins